MGLFGKSLDEMAKNEIKLRNKYVTRHQGEEIDFSTVDFEDEKVKNNKINLWVVYIASFVLLFTLFYLIFIGNPFVDTGISLKEFNQIQNGMSYSQVAQIVGEPGTMLSSLDLNIGAEYATEVYSWYGKDNISNANITFQGGKVVMKVQLFLK